MIGHGKQLDYTELRQTTVTAIHVAQEITNSSGKSRELN